MKNYCKYFLAHLPSLNWFVELLESSICFIVYVTVNFHPLVGDSTYRWDAEDRCRQRLIADAEDDNLDIKIRFLSLIYGIGFAHTV